MPLAPVRVAAETKCVGGGGATAGVETIGDLLSTVNYGIFGTEKWTRKLNSEQIQGKKGKKYGVLFSIKLK